MSSTYSGDHRDGFSARTSTKSFGTALHRTRAWFAEVENRSVVSSGALSLSDRASEHDDLDLDLDSLFKRLDKYTAEMQEVEERLKRARSDSTKHNASSLTHGPAQTPERPASQSASGASETTSLPKTMKVPTERPSRSVASSRTSTLAYRGREEALAALQGNEKEQEQRTKRDEVSSMAFGEWKSQMQQHYLATQASVKRSSSQYSRRLDSIQISPKREFVWRESSPGPMLKETRRTPTLHDMDEASSPSAKRTAGEESQVDYLSDEDEPGPSVPSSWALPPRKSSKKALQLQALPPRTSSRRVMSDEHKQDQETAPPIPAPRRRMTTSDGRHSVRNGGLWSDQSLGLLEASDVPPVPPLSASNSIATMQSSSPPLTPLMGGPKEDHFGAPLTTLISGPREDQVRRELEVYSIQDGAEALEHRYKKRRPPMLDLEDSDTEPTNSVSASNAIESDTEDDTNSLHPAPRRRKSIFSIFQRRSPVEKLIDMYLDDEPEEKSVMKRRSTWSRKASPTLPQDKIPLSPAIPPEFLKSQATHGKNTSV
jgi:hypothetical protein